MGDILYYVYGLCVLMSDAPDIYTERQKKRITSSERHTLNSKALKWTIIGHTLALLLLTKHIQKLRLLESKRNEVIESARGHFSKITETAARLSGTGLGTDNSQYGDYITRLWNCMNSSCMFSIDSLSLRFSGSSFCDFWKVTFCDFSAFSSLCQNQPFNFSDVLHIAELL